MSIGRMIVGISPHNLVEPDFIISFQELLWGRASRDIQIDSHPKFLIRLSWTWQDVSRTSVRTIARSRICRFLKGGAVGLRLLKSLNRFTVDSFYPIDRKLRILIFFIFPTGRCGSCFLKISHWFTAYSSHPIELKLWKYNTSHESAQFALRYLRFFLVSPPEKSLFHRS